MSDHDTLPPADGRPDDAAEDAALPHELLGTLRSAWRNQAVPPLDRELSAADEATQRAVGWMAAAWRAPGVLEPSAEAAQRTRFAVRRRAAPHAARVTVRRQLAAAALLIALLTAALHLDALLPFADHAAGRREAQPQALPPHGALPPVAAAPRAELPTAAIAPRAELPTAAVAPRPDVRSAPVAPPAHHAPVFPAPRHADAVAVPPLVAATDTASAPPSAPAPPIELRSGSVRLLLFTDASLRVPEKLP